MLDWQRLTKAIPFVEATSEERRIALFQVSDLNITLAFRDPSYQSFVILWDLYGFIWIYMDLYIYIYIWIYGWIFGLSSILPSLHPFAIRILRIAEGLAGSSGSRPRRCDLLRWPAWSRSSDAWHTASWAAPIDRPWRWLPMGWKLSIRNLVTQSVRFWEIAVKIGTLGFLRNKLEIVN